MKLNAKIIITKEQNKTSARWGKVLVNVKLGKVSGLIGDVHDF